MGLKGLFDKITVSKTVSNKTAAEIGDVVESEGYHQADIVEEKRSIPRIDFSKPENFAKYGSAEKYYEDSFTYVYSSYPYDGSLREKVEWRNSGSFIDLYLFDNEYPRTNGYIKMSYGGWGGLNGSITADGYGLPDDLEYISLQGGPHIKSAKPQTRSANIWKSSADRESNLKFNLDNAGSTIEFWLKKQAFDVTKTHKEVIFDLWNNEDTSSADYGRVRLELTGAGNAQLGADPFRLTVLSGTTGFTAASLTPATMTTSSVADNTWHHYAVSLTNTTKGRSIEFDGADDAINIGSAGTWNSLIGGSLAGTDTKAFTISLWFHSKDISSNQNLIHFGDYDRAVYLNSSRIRFQIDGVVENGRVQTAVLNSNQWYHLVVTYDGSDPAGNTAATEAAMKIYLDGADTSATVGGGLQLNEPSSISADDCAIGAELSGTPGGIFNGYIDEIGVWSHEMSSAEVTELYNGGIPSNLRNHSKAVNLLSWWPMGDNNTVAFDGTNVSSITNRVKDIVGFRHGYGVSGDLASSQIKRYSPTNNTVTAKLYRDGKLENSKLISIGVTALSGTVKTIGGGVEAHIGALIKAPKGSSAVLGAGKLTGSLDEFRYWKTKRTGRDIGRYWFTQVGGGTNSDLANTKLGVYYKFNEGITEIRTTDSTILDYSGRVTNGTWTGYAAGARSTGSAIVESKASGQEFQDPIVYSYNPRVNAKLSDLKLSGSAYDFSNPSRLLSYFPSWIQEEDAARGGDELKKLTQIMSSYFDNLYLQVEEFGKIQDVEYVSGSMKPNTLANKLLDSRGILSPELFLDADILEQLGDRSETLRYQKSLNDIKNTIYQNIYNNLINIFKSKGTKKSFRNLLRCFGIDDEIYKINVYGNNIEYEVRNNRELNSAKKSFVDFNDQTRFDATLLQQTSSANSQTVSYLSASNRLTGGYASTLESYVLFPDKPKVYEEGYSNSQYWYITSSLFGLHNIEPNDPNNLTWPSLDPSNFYVCAVRDELGSRDAKFVLTSSYASSVIPTLTSSYYDDVYNNTNWVFAVTVKPAKYPLNTLLASTGSRRRYKVEFKGANVDAGVTLNSFVVTGTIDPNSAGYGFVTGSKRVFAGAHRANFTGSLISRSDARIGFVRYWLDDIEPDILQQHALDVQNYGTKNPSKSPYLFQDFNPAGFSPLNIEFNQADTLALNWDFETVSTSDAAGTFEVPDFSSGSVTKQSERFGYLGNLLGAQHTGLGYGFPTSSTQVVDPDYVIAAELQNFEQLNSKDMISILDTSDSVQFTRESRPINFKFAIEKSMYQNISENMIRIFSVINDFSNIVGEPVHKYRSNYKDLRVLRQQFFERVDNTPDLDRYIEFYKWFDSSLSRLLEQLVPAGADFSENIRTVVESHILERNKYPFRFPTVEKIPAVFNTGIGDDIPGETNPEATPDGGGSGGGGGGSSTGPSLPGDCQSNCQDLVPPPEDDSVPTTDATNKLDPTEGAETHGKVPPWKPPTGDDCKDDPKKCTSGDETVDNYKRQIDLAVRVPRTNYRVRASGRIPLHLGSNFPKEKRPSDVFNYARPWTTSSAPTSAPKNIALTKEDQLQTFREKSRYRIGRPIKNVRLGFGMDTMVNKSGEAETAGVDFVGDGTIAAPFSMYSASAEVPSEVSTRFKSDITLTNLHDDLVGKDLCASPQGPFTERFVGGRQYRHVRLFKSTERPEGWKIALGGVSSSAGGFFHDALAIVPPNYILSSSTTINAIDVPPGHMLREEAVKRRVNVKNILMSTASLDIRLSGTIQHDRIGNYTKNWQVVQAPSRTANDPYFARQTFTFSTVPETYKILRGRLPFGTNYNPFTFGVPSGTLNFALPNRDGANSNQTYFVSKFRAPGSFNEVSRGFLDPAHEEKSVYSVLPWRNLGVRNYGMSGSNFDPSLTGSLRPLDQINRPRGLRQLLTLHCGIWGLDAIYGDITASVPSASYHKINRNQRPRKKYDTGGNLVTGSSFDNWFIIHPIPRTEKYYSWITSSLRPNQELWDYSHLSGGYFVEALPTISGAVDNKYGDFVGLSSIVLDPVHSPVVTDGNFTTQGANTLGVVGFEASYDGSNTLLQQYYNSDVRLPLNYGPHPYKFVTMLNLLLLNRNGPYQWAQFQQRRPHDHPIMRYNRENSVISVRTPTAYDNQQINVDGNALTQFIEPAVYSQEHPLVYTMRATPQAQEEIAAANNDAVTPVQWSKTPINLKITNTYGNEIANYATYELDSLLKTSKPYDSPNLYANRLNELILQGASTDVQTTAQLSNISVGYRQRTYPAAYNAHLSRTFKRERYAIDNIWNRYRDKRTTLPKSRGITPANSQGNSILSQSIWPLDPHYDFTTDQNASGSGELQNYYGTFDKTEGGNAIQPAVTYARRAPVGFDSSGIAMFGGDTMWEMRNNSGAQYSVPYETYEEYCYYLKLVGRDYSLIPEYRSSLYLEEHLITDDANFLSLDNISDNFEITGSKYDDSSYTGFFQEYANSDFMKLFKEVDQLEGALLVDGTTLSKQVFGLSCTAIVKPLPYKGFYPAERMLELGTLLSQSVGPYTYPQSNGGTSNPKAWRILLDSWSALLGNSIKSGISVGSGIFTTGDQGDGLRDITADQAKNSANQVYPEGVINYGANSIFSASADRNDNKYCFDRLPFEALYNLSHYTSNAISGSTTGDFQGYMFDGGLASASLSASSNSTVGASQICNKIVWKGDRGPLYDLAIDNFLASSLYWFINPDARPVFRSSGQSQFKDQDVKKDEKFAMSFHFNRPVTSDGAADRNAFEMYSRASAFGQPMALDDGFTDTVTGVEAAGFIDLTSSVYVAGAKAAGTLEVTGTMVAGGTYWTGSVKIGQGSVNYDALADQTHWSDGGSIYLTSSLNNARQFTYWTGSTATGMPASGYTVKVGSSKPNSTDWYLIATGSSNDDAAEHLNDAINASALVTGDGMKAYLYPARSSFVELTQSGQTCDPSLGHRAVTYGRNRLTASSNVFAADTGLGFSGSVNYYRLASGDNFTLGDGGLGGGIGSTYWSFTSASAQTPGGTTQAAEMVPCSVSASMLNMCKTINERTNFNVYATMSSPSAGWNTSLKGRIEFENVYTGSAGNVTLNTANMSYFASGFGAGTGLAGGVTQVRTLIEDDTWTVSDGGTDGGSTLITFTAKDSPAGSNQFLIAGNNASASANALKDAINAASGLGVTATMPHPVDSGHPAAAGAARIFLTNDNAGADGNVAITDSLNCSPDTLGSNVGGMSGGTDDVTSTIYSASIAPWLPSYFYGKSRVDIICTASYNGEQNLTDLLQSADYVYTRDMESTTYDATSVGYLMAQQISESFHLNQNVPNLLRDGSLDPTWVIQPKWECPVLNFKDASPTTPAAATTTISGNCSTSIVSKGMWHQTGSFAHSRAGITCYIDTPAYVTSNKYGTIRNVKSLAELVGFEEGTVKALGNIRDLLTIKEAIVAIPFVIDEDGRRKFYKLPQSANAIAGLRQNMMDYIFPPTFDFVTHPTVEPVSMYVFEFKTTLGKQDIADIWQNMLPKAWRDQSKVDTFEYQTSTIQHPIGAGELLNKTTRKLRSDLRWLVFKVKQRAKSNYTTFRDSYLSQTDADGRDDRRRVPYTYNWPNDWLSVVELVKIDEGIQYSPTAPPITSTAIAGTVDVNVVNAGDLAADVNVHGATIVEADRRDREDTGLAATHMVKNQSGQDKEEQKRELDANQSRAQELLAEATKLR